MFQETVILAERAVVAGLTEGAAFPMIKKPVVCRWSLVVRRAFTVPAILVLANDQRLRTHDDFLLCA